MSVRLRLKTGLRVYDALNELAVDRSTYTKRVKSFYPTIVSHWCLCEYCNLYDNDNLNFYHWAKELRDSLSEVKNDYTPNANKIQVLNQVWIDEKGLNVPEQVKIISQDKIKDEGLYDSPLMEQVYINFADGVDDLIGVIGDKNRGIKQYLLEKFGVEVNVNDVTTHKKRKRK